MANTKSKISNKVDEKTVKKIGSVPIGYEKNSTVFISDNKIYIANLKKK